MIQIGKVLKLNSFQSVFALLQFMIELLEYYIYTNYYYSKFKCFGVFRKTQFLGFHVQDIVSILQSFFERILVYIEQKRQTLPSDLSISNPWRFFVSV